MPEGLGFIVVFCTTGSREEAEKLADTLVEEKLAACVTIVGPVLSVYRWKGKVERGEEYLLVIKTKRSLYSRLESRLRELHSYEVLEIVALPIVEGLKDYLSWLSEKTG